MSEAILIGEFQEGEFHPGEYLADELKSRHIRQNAFAPKVGVQPSLLNEIIKGKRSISTAFALKLESALGIDAEFWLKTQMSYDLRKLRLVAKKFNLKHFLYEPQN